MNSWSRARKRIILAIALFVVVVLIGVPLYFLFYQKPTCFDKKLNGDETGIDCGGSCQLLCNAESLPLIARGDPRVLAVAENVFEVIVLVENPNVAAEIYRAKYIFKVYGSSSTTPVKIIKGETFVPKGTTFAIFEGPFTLEGRVLPTRATFEWQKETLIWQRNDAPVQEIAVKDQILSQADSSPRIEVTVENLSPKRVSSIDLVALVSDKNGNVFAASKTFLDSLASNDEAVAVFTWPRPFSTQTATIDIYTRILPDRSFLR
ncbi:MAG: hypothetical protein HYT69_01645 [Candidatus Zambryskibacteria bacterium]|nr:hypothetical protein [Candidatus Zambryskibacteria bacterium]